MYLSFIAFNMVIILHYLYNYHTNIYLIHYIPWEQAQPLYPSLPLTLTNTLAAKISRL